MTSRLCFEHQLGSGVIGSVGPGLGFVRRKLRLSSSWVHKSVLSKIYVTWLPRKANMYSPVFSCKKIVVELVQLTVG